MIREQIKDHVLILALSRSVTPREDTWLIDSGASKHMTGQINILSCISEKKFSHKVTLGDDYQYHIKGVGESNHKLNSGNSLKMKDILYVLALKKNLLSISSLQKKGFRFSFIDAEVLMWAKGETLNESIIIGSEENGLYKLHSEAAMTHAIKIHVNFGMEGYPTSTTRHYHTYAKWSQVYQNSKVTINVYAMDVHKGRTSRTHF
jgi:hypothetical protein